MARKLDTLQKYIYLKVFPDWTFPGVDNIHIIHVGHHGTAEYKFAS